jgi:hypothetical protein
MALDFIPFTLNHQRLFILKEFCQETLTKLSQEYFTNKAFNNSNLQGNYEPLAKKHATIAYIGFSIGQHCVFLTSGGGFAN